MSYKNKAKDLPYGQQSNEVAFRNYFDFDNGKIEFGDKGINQYDNSEYALNAYTINGVVDEIKAHEDNNPTTMQGYWYTEILQPLSQNNQSFQTWIEKMSSWVNGVKRTWVSGSANTYSKNEIVVYNDDGYFYLCLQDCDGTQSLPTTAENAYWARFYMRGLSGKNYYSNVNYVGKFDWATYNYNTNDIVFVPNESAISFYICLSSIGYATETTPDQDTAHWLRIFEIPRMTFDIWDSMPSLLSLEHNAVFAVKDSIDNTLIDIYQKVDSSTSGLSAMTSMSQVDVDGVASDTKLINLVQTYNL